MNVMNSNGNLVSGMRNMVYWKHLIKKNDGNYSVGRNCEDTEQLRTMKNQKERNQ